MKTPKPTKESLTLQLAKAQDVALSWAQSDERKRKEFAKAFNWVKNSQMNSFSNHVEKEPQNPSWEQIFVHVGKLLVLEELKQKIVSPFPPNGKVL